MTPAGFEPTIPGSERPQTHALEDAVPWIGFKEYNNDDDDDEDDDNNNNNNNNKYQYQYLDTVLELLTGTKKNCKN